MTIQCEKEREKRDGMEKCRGAPRGQESVAAVAKSHNEIMNLSRILANPGCTGFLVFLDFSGPQGPVGRIQAVSPHWRTSEKNPNCIIP